jgi:hypothetical protein
MMVSLGFMQVFNCKLHSKCFQLLQLCLILFCFPVGSLWLRGTELIDSLGMKMPAIRPTVAHHINLKQNAALVLHPREKLQELLYPQTVMTLLEYS